MVNHFDSYSPLNLNIYHSNLSIFKPDTCRPQCAWFLEITFVPPKYVCVFMCVIFVCVCVCVCTPEAINNLWCDLDFV